MFNSPAVRVTDTSILTAKMERVTDLASTSGAIEATGSVYAVSNSSQISLAALVYALKGASVAVAEKGFESGGHRITAGSLVIGDVGRDKLQAALKELDLTALALTARPSVPTHPAVAPRIAFMHTWLYTQTEGWSRQAFDRLQVPYDYISTQVVAKEPNLRSKYDAIIFAPVARVTTEQIISGMPMWGNAVPWQKTSLTPNLGGTDETPDMRPGLGFGGLANLKSFVEDGGLLITAEDTAQFAIEEGLAPGVFVAPPKDAKVVGSILKAVVVDKAHPAAYGYGADLAVYSADGMAFTVGNATVNRHVMTDKDYKRPTGRGGPDDEDAPEGRANTKAEPLPSTKPWQPAALNEEQTRNNPFVIPEQYRPDVILRFADAKTLLLSGLLDGGSAIAERPIVVDAHLGKGNVLLFANNPIYRGETMGSYALVFNALMNWDRLQKSKPVN